MVDSNLVAGTVVLERHAVKLVRENPSSEWSRRYPSSLFFAMASATVAADPRSESTAERTHPVDLQTTTLLEMITEWYPGSFSFGLCADRRRDATTERCKGGSSRTGSRKTNPRADKRT